MARRSRNHDYYLLFYLILNIARIVWFHLDSEVADPQIVQFDAIQAAGDRNHHLLHHHCLCLRSTQQFDLFSRMYSSQLIDKTEHYSSYSSSLPTCSEHSSISFSLDMLYPKVFPQEKGPNRRALKDSVSFLLHSRWLLSDLDVLAHFLVSWNRPRSRDRLQSLFYPDFIPDDRSQAVCPLLPDDLLVFTLSSCLCWKNTAVCRLTFVTTVWATSSLDMQWSAITTVWILFSRMLLLLVLIW